MLSRALVFVVAGLAVPVSSGCGGSSDEGANDEGANNEGANNGGAKKITFYVEGMGEKLKLL